MPIDVVLTLASERNKTKKAGNAMRLDSGTSISHRWDKLN